MLAVACPFCHSRLKTPLVKAGVKVRCPKCRGALVFREDSKSKLPVLAPREADVDTVESAALEQTAEQTPLKVNQPTVAEKPEPVEERRIGAIPVFMTLVALAGAGAFALWKATGGKW